MQKAWIPHRAFTHKCKTTSHNPNFRNIYSRIITFKKIKEIIWNYPTNSSRFFRGWKGQRLWVELRGLGPCFASTVGQPRLESRTSIIQRLYYKILEFVWWCNAGSNLVRSISIFPGIFARIICMILRTVATADFLFYEWVMLQDRNTHPEWHWTFWSSKASASRVPRRREAWVYSMLLLISWFSLIILWNKM